MKVNPTWSDALYGLTLVCIRLGKSAEAIEQIRRALRVEGPNAKEHLKYALALAYRANAQFDKANEAYLPIMKDEKTIFAYRDMIEKKNNQVLE